MNVFNDYSKYIISKSLDINTLTTFLKAFPIIQLYHKSIDIPFNVSIFMNLKIIKNNINVFPVLKYINIIYYSSNINNDNIITINKIYDYINKNKNKNYFKNINIKFNFIQEEIFIHNNKNNFIEFIKDKCISENKFYEIIDLNLNNINNIKILNLNLNNEKYIPIYSFNDIKYSDLYKIEKIMNLNSNKNLYFTIDNNPCKFNNFNELNKSIIWNLYYDSYTFNY